MSWCREAKLFSKAFECVNHWHVLLSSVSCQNKSVWQRHVLQALQCRSKIEREARQQLGSLMEIEIEYTEQCYNKGIDMGTYTMVIRSSRSVAQCNWCVYNCLRRIQLFKLVYPLRGYFIKERYWRSNCVDFVKKWVNLAVNLLVSNQ